MRNLIVTVLLALPLPLVAGAQAASTVSPGMNRAQVVAALGEPATARTASEYTYLFYRNDCGKACGMNDLVVLRRDSVVDAIFRAPGRRYTGTSSSPAPVSRTAARRGATPAAHPPLRTTSPAQRPQPGPPNDTRPSIPAGAPAVRPSTAPTTRP